MTAPFACTRCQLREPGTHDCQDRACHCCYGETDAPLWVCYCGAVQPFVFGVFPHRDCDGGRPLTPEEIAATGTGA